MAVFAAVIGLLLTNLVAPAVVTVAAWTSTAGARTEVAGPVGDRAASAPAAMT